MSTVKNRLSTLVFLSLVAHVSYAQQSKTPAAPTEDTASIQVPAEWVANSSAAIDSSLEVPLRESHSLRLSASFIGGGKVSTETYLPDAETFASSALPALFLSYRSPGLFASSKLAAVAESGLEWRRRSSTLSIDNAVQNVSQDLYRFPLLGGVEWSAYISPSGNFEVSANALIGAIFQTTSRSAIGPEGNSRALRWKGEAHLAYRPAFLPRGVLAHAALFAGRDEFETPVAFFGLRTGLTTAF